MIGILLIATRKYKQFVQPLLDQLAENFLDGYKKTAFVFTDEEMKLNGHGTEIKRLQIPPYRFPQATLYRYKIFNGYRGELKNCTYIFYSDVDMGFIAPIGSEIMGAGLTVVRHPGFYANGGYGSPNTAKESLAYVPPEGREKYFCGGFNGGRADIFLQMSKELAANIDDDESRGVMAEYHDESHLNAYLYKHPEIPRTELTPSYCMPEQPHFKQSWGLGELPSIILALSKNHSEIRA